MREITIKLEVYDATALEEIERAVSATLDGRGVDCTYNIEERYEQEWKWKQWEKQKK